MPTNQERSWSSALERGRVGEDRAVDEGEHLGREVLAVGGVRHHEVAASLVNLEG